MVKNSRLMGQEELVLQPSPEENGKAALAMILACLAASAFRMADCFSPSATRILLAFSPSACRMDSRRSRSAFICFSMAF